MISAGEGDRLGEQAREESKMDWRLDCHSLLTQICVTEVRAEEELENGPNSENKLLLASIVEKLNHGRNYSQQRCLSESKQVQFVCGHPQ